MKWRTFSSPIYNLFWGLQLLVCYRPNLQLNSSRKGSLPRSSIRSLLPKIARSGTNRNTSSASSIMRMVPNAMNIWRWVRCLALRPNVMSVSGRGICFTSTYQLSDPGSQWRNWLCGFLRSRECLHTVATSYAWSLCPSTFKWLREQHFLLQRSSLLGRAGGRNRQIHRPAEF